MHWFRQSQLFAARILTLWLAFLAGPALLLHGGGDDACEVPLVAHDAANHRFEAGTPTAGYDPVAEHCQACHFPRTLPALASTVTFRLSTTTPIAQQLDASAGFLVATLLPARSPPA